jgi:hypothetical protein
VEVNFSTSTLQVHDKKSFEEVFLATKKSCEFFSKVPKDELTFEVVSTNEDAEASFPFGIKDGGPNSSFDVTQLADGSLEAKIKGEFSLTMRAGADKALRAVGKKLDLRVRGVMWKGGAYNGFMAWVKDSDYEQNSARWFETFPEVHQFSIK